MKERNRGLKEQHFVDTAGTFRGPTLYQFPDLYYSFWTPVEQIIARLVNQLIKSHG